MSTFVDDVVCGDVLWLDREPADVDARHVEQVIDEMGHRRCEIDRARRVSQRMRDDREHVVAHAYSVLRALEGACVVDGCAGALAELGRDLDIVCGVATIRRASSRSSTLLGLGLGFRLRAARHRARVLA